MEKTNIDFGIIEETFEIVIAFDQQGKILFGNKSAREKLDYSEEELKDFLAGVPGGKSGVCAL